MSAPNISRLIVGMCQTNCYIVSDPVSREAIVIDPGDNADGIIEIVESGSLILKGIVNTHCHGDHIVANSKLKAHFGCPIMIHELDAPGLEDSRLNLSGLMGFDGPLSPPADRMLVEGDRISIGGIDFEVIHTPGHTQGCICMLTDGILFSGDTLFAGSVGRTDFPGGSHPSLLESVHSKLLILPDSTTVYPGHGPATSIGTERSTNPWL